MASVTARRSGREHRLLHRIVNEELSLSGRVQKGQPIPRTVSTPGLRPPIESPAYQQGSGPLAPSTPPPRRRPRSPSEHHIRHRSYDDDILARPQIHGERDDSLRVRFTVGHDPEGAAGGGAGGDNGFCDDSEPRQDVHNE
eukprot:TRINITY_DN9137_c0_g1_i1.p1 TRINITY_DN9137_c0_g1~~TRINITY_DN9137_c0_g1_i1.p1  ORF type:complete len:141 (-),score=10.19 TRINITY_DN9137_c0_g1_i1:6-428(-)